MHDPILQKYVRDAIAYDKSALADLKLRGEEEQFLPGTLDFYHKIEPILLKDVIALDDLQYIWLLTEDMLKNDNYYPGIVLSFIIERIDHFLTESHPSFAQRSLWTTHSKRF